MALVLVGYSGQVLQAQANEWTWWGGGGKINGPGVYGSLGVPAAANLPGVRQTAMSWTDHNGNFWLFGGGGCDSAGECGYLNDLWEYSPTTHEWTWMNGSETLSSFNVGGLQTYGQVGVYGTLGQPAAGNSPGGRVSAATWIDSSGKLWLFGGYGLTSSYSGFMPDAYIVDFNDLWMYDPSINEWTWMGGNSTVPTSNLESSGVYGTLGEPAAGNIPGARADAVTWVDNSGNLWLFGGYGFDSAANVGDLNDLWRFTPSAGEWTWMGGSSVMDCELITGNCNYETPGVYGTLGVPDPANIPGSRHDAVAWTDNGGNLWLFGGTGASGQGGGGVLNDLWEFSPSTNEWAWMNGAKDAAHPGSFGTLGVASKTNTPGGLDSASGWKDSQGNLWLFGGIGSDILGDFGYFNNLWVFNPSTNEWAWMGGNKVLPGMDLVGQPGVYGTLGTPDAANIPGGRALIANWTDKNGNLWLFGGYGAEMLDNVVAPGWFLEMSNLNDLWQYQPAAASLPPALAPAFNPAPGSYTITTPMAVTISDQMANTSIYYTTDGTTPTLNSTAYTGAIQVGSTETIRAIAAATGYPNSGVVSASYAITLIAAYPVFSPNGGVFTSAQKVTMSDPTPGATIYYTTDGSTPTTASTQYSGEITVSATEALRAVAVAPGYSTSMVNIAYFTINPNPPTFALGAAPGLLTMSYGGTGSVKLTVTPQNGFNAPVSFACSGLPSGASCAFNPSTVTPAASAATTTLTVTAPTTSAALLPFRHSLLPATSLAFVISIFGWKWRRGLHPWLLLLAVCAGLGTFTACGGGSSGGGGGGSNPITATVTVTATSGSLQQKAAFTLTVN
jgi:N-acetylneuraminic acid mutarotase